MKTSPMKTSPIRPLAAALALSTVLTLSACSGDEPATFEPATQGSGTVQDTADDAADATAPGEGADDSQASVSQESAAAAGIDLNELGAPIATATVPAVVQGDADATIEVSLYSLKREGDVLFGTFSFTVTADGVQEPDWLYSYLGEHAWKPYLIDTTNLTRHDVLSDDIGVTRAQTDVQGNEFLPGQTLYAYAGFAVPPEDVSTVTVQLIDGAPAVTGIEIQ